MHGQFQFHACSRQLSVNTEHAKTQALLAEPTNPPAFQHRRFSRFENARIHLHNREKPGENKQQLCQESIC